MCWIHFSQPALSTTFLFPVKSYFCLAASPVASLNTRRRSSSGRGQMSSLSCLWPCSVCWALSPFPTRALSLCTNPQSHPGRAHGTGSCPPHRCDCSRAPVVRKALYRLKTQTPSTGRGGAEPLFPSVKHPGLVGPCVSLGRAGRSTALLCHPWGLLHWRGMGPA